MHLIWLAMALVLDLDVSGTIRDSSGGVLAGAVVVAFDDNGRNRRWRARPPTNRDGTA